MIDGGMKDGARKPAAHELDEDAHEVADPLTTNKWIRPVSVLGQLSVAALLLTVTTDVSLRYGFNLTMIGVTELVQFWWMPLIAAIGFIVAQGRDEHLRMDALITRLSTGARSRAESFQRYLTAAYVAVLALFSGFSAYRAWQRGEGGILTDVPIWPVRVLLVLSLLAMAVAAIRSNRNLQNTGPGA